MEPQNTFLPIPRLSALDSAPVLGRGRGKGQKTSGQLSHASTNLLVFCRVEGTQNIVSFLLVVQRRP